MGQDRALPDADRANYVNFYLNGGKVIVGDNNIEIGEGAQVRGAVGRGNKITGSTFGDSAVADNEFRRCRHNW